MKMHCAFIDGVKYNILTNNNYLVQIIGKGQVFDVSDNVIETVFCLFRSFSQVGNKFVNICRFFPYRNETIKAVLLFFAIFCFLQETGTRKFPFSKSRGFGIMMGPTLGKSKPLQRDKLSERTLF